MKKIISIILVAVITLTMLVGCSDEKSKENKQIDFYLEEKQETDCMSITFNSKKNSKFIIDKHTGNRDYVSEDRTVLIVKFEIENTGEDTIYFSNEALYVTMDGIPNAKYKALYSGNGNEIYDFKILPLEKITTETYVELPTFVMQNKPTVHITYSVGGKNTTLSWYVAYRI